MIYFLLCVYNEGENIISVIANIRKKVNSPYKIIIINDGSTDDTLDKIEQISSEKKDIFIINHCKNLGLGAALKTGFDYIYDMLTENDVVITMDADNTHPVEIGSLMIQKYLQGCDVVIASRYCCGGRQLGVPFFRRVLSWLAKILLKILFPYDEVKDYTSGYRLYSGKIIKNLYKCYKENLITQKNFVVQLELLVKLFKLKPKIAEVPLRIEYFKKSGKSKLKIVKNIISYIKIIFYFKFKK
ncbi:MAG: glycosyltransferase [Endomicrobia bacterium]|nr:glycosyltransferase [Endomicrobiia bacterium]